MQELNSFYEKLSFCDLLVLTPVTQERCYCRFYTCGVYLDRIFITDSALLEELQQLSNGDDVIDANGVKQLQEKYKGMVEQAKDGQ